MKRITVLIIAVALIPFYGFSQRIDAPVIGEWKSQKKLGFEYRYNSASAYLINGKKLPDLFTGSSLTRKERKKHKLKSKDYPKYLYFYLEIPNPKNENEIIKVPLYFIDATNKTNVAFSNTSQGRILDEIKDEELEYKPLNATGKIEAIKGNTTAEFVSKSLSISNDLLKTAISIGSGSFGIGKIAETVQKGGDFFSKIAKDKAVNNEFLIPIIKDSDFFQYELVSLSVHQIKWEFRSKASDPLTSAKDQEKSLQELLNLLDENHPYLIVARYKSYYVLPSDYVKNVEITQSYLNTRQSKIVEFSGMKRSVEQNLLESLKDAVSIRKDYEVYKRGQEVNEPDYDAISRIINSYYLMRSRYEAEISMHDSNSSRKEYFEQNYTEAYRILFNKLDKYLRTDLSSSKAVVTKYFELKDKDLNKIEKNEFCSHIEVLDIYRELIKKQSNANKSIAQIKGLTFYPKFQNLMEDLEKTLYDKAFDVSKIVTDDEKVSFLESQLSNSDYSCCEDCKNKSNQIITDIQKATDESKRIQLNNFKSEYLQILQCWDIITNNTRDSLSTKYPPSEIGSLSPIQKKLYEEYEKHYQNLVSYSNDYFDIEQLNTDDLNSSELTVELSKYSLLISNSQQSITFLVNGGIIPKNVVTCAFK